MCSILGTEIHTENLSGFMTAGAGSSKSEKIKNEASEARTGRQPHEIPMCILSSIYINKIFWNITGANENLSTYRHDH